MRALRLWLLPWLGLLAGCALTPRTEVADGVWDRPGDWDPIPLPGPCQADRATPLLDRALGSTEVVIGLDEADRQSSPYARAGALEDPFRLSWLRLAQSDATRLGCVEGEIAGITDRHLASPHPVAGLIRHAARVLDLGPDDAPPPAPAHDARAFDQALAALCALDPAGTGCPPGSGVLPADLARALAPVLAAVAEAAAARDAAHAAVELPPGPALEMWDYGGNHLTFDPGSPWIDPRLPGVGRYLLGGAPRARLYRAASQLAWAIESAGLERFAGRRGVGYRQPTPLGEIVIADAADQVHDLQPAPLLLVDLGGDDAYYGAAGSNARGYPVGLLIDVAGDDRYRYPEHGGTPDARLLPADAAGRAPHSAEAGPFSLSTEARQGAGRDGIGMLFDLGDGDDHYQSLNMSQGYAHLGVGVLFDGGGDDRYLAETRAQGAAVFGIAIAVDAGNGRDLRRAVHAAQGFGYSGGFGLLLDGGGDDVYTCEPGRLERGGLLLFPGSQTARRSNVSFCQGAGFGRRHDAHGVYLSGGVGVLRDAGGDDRYDAALFAQGTGYWQGAGFLSDADGADTYEAMYYAQGGGAHFALAVLADGGDGDDRFNTHAPPSYMHLGAGHDLSVGALLNERGDDVYVIAGLGAGASHCNGVGLLVDNAGDDAYRALNDYGSGLGEVGAECVEKRPLGASIGVMIDAGGTDRYQYPASPHLAPGDDSRWGQRRRGLPSELGIGLDAAGESGIHVGG